MRRAPLVEVMPRQEARAAMPLYHCLFIDLADRVGKVETMECTDDGVAQTCARELLDWYALDAIEVWDAGRRVHRAEKPRYASAVS